MPAGEVHVLGVRHHGPGSARTVLRALDELQPDRVLIEGPPELDALVESAAGPGLVPPVAALVYDTEQPRRASFCPFAAFSPEWVALRWALAHDVPVGFADLPAANGLAERPEEEEEGPPPGRPVDPIADLAAAAGATDPERWWEDAVEHRGAAAAGAFADIADAMRAVREDHVDDVELQRREAAMRLAVRRASAASERLAVICGAYHAPALDPAGFPTKRADEALLAGLPKTRVAATWVPWTSRRLATATGYGAGITAPGWYAHLFAEPVEPVASWMVKAARALRDEDLPASPAAVVEATRLAETLATLRGRPSAGLEEVTDALLAVLCEGSSVPLQLIEDQLVVGSELGSVPDDVPLVPLAGDLAREQRRLRLKPTAEPTALDLDLRRENPLARSVLLHRLRLIGVDWGTPAEARASGGTFLESWQLQWRPELSVELVVAGVYGTTIKDAAAAALAERAETAEELGVLGDLVEQALLADLPAALDAIVRRLAERTAQHGDVLGLLRTVEPLARVRRYGSVRGTDTQEVERVVTEIVTRASVGLRAACTSLDDDAAGAVRHAIEGAERGIRLLGLPDDEWVAGLGAVADDERVHGSVAGRATRMLLDRGVRGGDAVATAMARRLSAATVGPAGAAWLDGFVAGDAQVLLHDDALRTLVDEWLTGVSDAAFDDLLPLVRRTFAAFSAPERRLLGERLRAPAARSGTEDDGPDPARGLPAAVRVAELIGLEVRR